MEMTNPKNELIRKLRRDILSMQGFQPASLEAKQTDFGLGGIEGVFPYGTFPKGAVHEFVSQTPVQSAATSGFLAVLLGRLMRDEGFCVWIGTKRTLFPPALNNFGVLPHKVIFVDIKKEKDLLWAVEEAFKCSALAAVVGEIKELTLTESRRLQLALEKSKVTGLLHRINSRSTSAVASVCRWQINPLPTVTMDGLPGLGEPCWEVNILKVRNGEPRSWQVRWKHDHLEPVSVVEEDYREDRLKMG
jgi:protein ImuA